MTCGGQIDRGDARWSGRHGGNPRIHVVDKGIFFKTDHPESVLCEYGRLRVKRIEDAIRTCST